MAIWTTPKTWNVGDILTAADMNTYVRDNTNALVNGLYRKNIAKVVANSIAETDLLNAEITIAAGLIGANGIVRLSAWGDWVNNTGGAQAPPRFKLKLGATTLLDTNTTGANWTAAASRYGWRLDAEIQNLGATNSQWANLRVDGVLQNGVGAAATAFTTGEGLVSMLLSAGGFGLYSALGGAAGAVDTTAALALVFSVINGVANASYDTTLKGAVVEIV